MKLLNLSGCQFPGSRGKVKELAMIVEGHGMGFRTRVRLSSTPWKKARPVGRAVVLLYD